VNFWAALIFASLYQDKEVRKKSKINEEKTFEESILEIFVFYGNERNSKILRWII
jgi:hypothetical protein